MIHACVILYQFLLPVDLLLCVWNILLQKTWNIPASPTIAYTTSYPAAASATHTYHYTHVTQYPHWRFCVRGFGLNGEVFLLGFLCIIHIHPNMEQPYYNRQSPLIPPPPMQPWYYLLSQLWRRWRRRKIGSRRILGWGLSWRWGSEIYRIIQGR